MKKELPYRLRKSEKDSYVVEERRGFKYLGRVEARMDSVASFRGRNGVLAGNVSRRRWFAYNDIGGKVGHHDGLFPGHRTREEATAAIYKA
jgi:hypothetical protein